MSPATCYTRMPTPIGPLLLAGTQDALTAVGLPSGPDGLEPGPGWIETAAPFAEAVRQLEAYFAGTLRQFDLPLAPEGTPFQQRVWRALRDIPYGETVSYAEVARRIGRPAAVRAVGAANGQNPVAIVVPCHRVIGSDGRLVGYGGGLAMKAALLEHERRAVSGGHDRWATRAADRPGRHRPRLHDPRQVLLFPAGHPGGRDVRS